MPKRICIKCGLFPAAVPDREKQGRRVKEICRTCHVKRLVGDLKTLQRANDDLCEIRHPAHQSGSAEEEAADHGSSTPDVLTHRPLRR